MDAKNAICFSAATPPTSNIVAFWAPSRRGTRRSSSPRRTATECAPKTGGNLGFSVRILRWSSFVSRW